MMSFFYTTDEENDTYQTHLIYSILYPAHVELRDIKELVSIQFPCRLLV